MTTFVLSDTSWSSVEPQDHTNWDHEQMLKWIHSLNGAFFEQYSHYFRVAKLNGQDFQLLTDADYLETIFMMHPQHAADFSRIVTARVNGLARNPPSVSYATEPPTNASHNTVNEAHHRTHSEKPQSSHNYHGQDMYNDYNHIQHHQHNNNYHRNSNDNNNINNHNNHSENNKYHQHPHPHSAVSHAQKQHYRASTNEHTESNTVHLVQHQGFVMDTKKQDEDAPFQPFQSVPLQASPLQADEPLYSYSRPNQMASSLPLQAHAQRQPAFIKRVHTEMSVGPPLPAALSDDESMYDEAPPTKSDAHSIKADPNTQNVSSSNHHGHMQHHQHSNSHVWSAYNTQNGEQNEPQMIAVMPSQAAHGTDINDLLDDLSTDDDEEVEEGGIDLWSKIDTKGQQTTEYNRLSQSGTALSDAAAVLSEIDEKEADAAPQQEHNILLDVHKNDQGIAQLLIEDDGEEHESEYKWDVQLNECKKMWTKQRALDANIQFVSNQNHLLHDQNQTNIKLITYQCLQKLDKLLTAIGNGDASRNFFEIHRDESQRILQSILSNLYHSNAPQKHKQSLYSEESELFTKLQTAPTVLNNEAQQSHDYSVMISMCFSIQYDTDIAHNAKNKQVLLIQELAIALAIHPSFLRIVSSGAGNGGFWYLRIKIEMWPYLFYLREIEGQRYNELRQRHVLQYQFNFGEEIDVKRKNKWYICKVKAITAEAKHLENKGKLIKVGYIGKYVERNGHIAKEMGKPFKWQKNTESLWSIEDAHRFRVQRLSVIERMNHQFLKVALRA